MNQNDNESNIRQIDYEFEYKLIYRWLQAEGFTLIEEKDAFQAIVNIIKNYKDEIQHLKDTIPRY